MKQILPHNINWCLCLDVDGVIGQMLLRPLGTKEFTLSQSQELRQIGAILKTLHQKGVDIVLNTGRGLVETNLIVSEMGFGPNDINFICEHGAMARINNQEIGLLPHNLNTSASFLAHKIVNFLRQSTNPKFEILDKHSMCTVQLPQSIIGDTDQVKNFYNQLVTIIHRVPHFDKYQSTFKILLGSESVDLILLDWNKAKALNKYRQIKGLTAEKTLSVGDTLNDQSMMEISGFAAAPSNGSELSDYFTNHRKAGTYFLATQPVALGTLQILDWFSESIITT